MDCITEGKWSPLRERLSHRTQSGFTNELEVQKSCRENKGVSVLLLNFIKQSFPFQFNILVTTWDISWPDNLGSSSSYLWSLRRNPRSQWATIAPVYSNSSHHPILHITHPLCHLAWQSSVPSLLNRHLLFSCSSVPLYVPQRVRVCFFCKLFLLSSRTKYILWFLFLNCYCLAMGLSLFLKISSLKRIASSGRSFSFFIWSVFVLSLFGMSH